MGKRKLDFTATQQSKIAKLSSFGFGSDSNVIENVQMQQTPEKKGKPE